MSTRPIPSHSIRRSIATLCLLIATSGPASTWAQSCDYSASLTVAEDIVSDYFLVSGSSLWISGPLTADSPPAEVTAYFGNHDAQTVVPIASASKLLSAICIMTLVEDGLLLLDQPISTYLPQFTGLAGSMTMRQLFSHTSGLPPQADVTSDGEITLEQAVDEIACCVPLDAAPGTQFAYGGVSMHVGGRIAEVVTGLSWEALFAERVAIPLGLTQTDYQGLGATNNPRIAGGARSSLEDYSRVMQMLRDDGMFNGVTILTPESIEQLFADQTQGVPIVESPLEEGTRYGLGTWRNTVNSAGEAIRVSCPGAFGFSPWLDLQTRQAGVFMVLFSWTQLRADIEQIWELTRQQALACAGTSLFRRGDANGDGSIDVSDPIALLSYLFASGAPLCLDAFDGNDDGNVNLTDVFFVLNFAFVGGNPPSPPFPGCGFDTTLDTLDCATAADCD